MFEIFQPNSMKRKAVDPVTEAENGKNTESKKKIKNESNSQIPNNPMKVLEEKINDNDNKQEKTIIDLEEEKDLEALREQENENKEKESKKKYMIEKFDIDITTEDFGCLHEIVAPKGFQRKGLNKTLNILQ